jgi:hypothetical protein
LGFGEKTKICDRKKSPTPNMDRWMGRVALVEIINFTSSLLYNHNSIILYISKNFIMEGIIPASWVEPMKNVIFETYKWGPVLQPTVCLGKFKGIKK